MDIEALKEHIDEIFGSQNWDFIDGLLVVKQLGIARILNPKNKDTDQ